MGSFLMTNQNAQNAAFIAERSANFGTTGEAMLNKMVQAMEEVANDDSKYDDLMTRMHEMADDLTETVARIDAAIDDGDHKVSICVRGLASRP